ncbi:MAG: hypothetical protein ABIY51_15170 [Ferruginibacter sp.]
MMPNRNTDILFQLIHALEKSEKRNFKLYIQRSSGNKDLKVIELFDAIDKLTDYDEIKLLQKLSSIKKPQLANAKAHLYKQVLASLRVIKTTESIDLQLHEQLDYARILYNKGLYHQSLKILDKVKELAIEYNQDSFLIQVISLEKKIETLHITRSMQNRAEKLCMEADEVTSKRAVITKLSNLALQLYSWYIRSGHARNEQEAKAVRNFFKIHLPGYVNPRGFYEQLYYHQSYCWFAFIRQDFLMYYRHTQKWVDLFMGQPAMIAIESGNYIKGMHNLMNAHFDLRNYKKFEEAIQQFQLFSETEVANLHDNNRVQTFVYLSNARINYHMITGSFEKGLQLIPHIEKKLEEYWLFLDRHRVLVLNYKIATLHFAAGNYDKSIDYLRKIINDNVDLRNDLQCYSRLLHLLAHYEMGNYDIMDHLIKSVYRFMTKMENLSRLEEEMFLFLRKYSQLKPVALKPAFAEFLAKIKVLELQPFQARAFAYLDIISWVESKIQDKPLAIIIRKKYLASKRK